MNILPPYVYCGCVDNVQIFGKSFVALDNEAFIFHCQGYRNLGMHTFEDDLDIFKSHKVNDSAHEVIDDECIFLGGMFTEKYQGGFSHDLYGANFGHFIFEFLNRLVMFEQLGLLNKLPVVIYDCLPSRWEGFLELMGVSKEQLVRVPIVGTPAFRRVWLSSSCHYRDSRGLYRFWGEGLSWLRSRCFASIGGAKISDRRRVYISRGDAEWRRVTNEDKVIDLLTAYGFEVPDMPKLSAHEQVELMSGAELIVSAAGAGCVMTHFAPESCIHIFMALKGGQQGPYGGLAGSVVMRQIFERMDCEAVESDVLKRTNKGGVVTTADYVVDLDALKANLDLALKMVERSHINDALAL